MVWEGKEEEEDDDDDGEGEWGDVLYDEELNNGWHSSSAGFIESASLLKKKKNTQPW